MVKKKKSEELYVKLGGVIACTGLLCVHREITQRPLSTEPRLICPYVCFAIHVIRGMHSCVVCVYVCVCVRVCAPSWVKLKTAWTLVGIRGCSLSVSESRSPHSM